VGGDRPLVGEQGTRLASRSCHPPILFLFLIDVLVSLSPDATNYDVLTFLFLLHKKRKAKLACEKLLEWHRRIVLEFKYIGEGIVFFKTT
jgi:hypothetical protein